MKKLSAILCAALLCVALLAGCGGGAGGTSSASSDQTSKEAATGSSLEESPSSWSSEDGSSLPAESDGAQAAAATETAEHLWLWMKGADDLAYWQTADGNLVLFYKDADDYMAQIDGTVYALVGDITPMEGAYFFAVAPQGAGPDDTGTPYVVRFLDDGGMALAPAASSVQAPVYYYSGNTQEDAAANVPGLD